MKNIVLIDKSGWVDGVIRTECEFRETDHPNHRCVEIEDYQLAGEIAHNGPIVWHDGSSFRLITEEKRIWQRLREQGFIGSNCRELYQGLVEKGSSRKILGEMGSAPLSKPTPITNTYSPIFACELQPSLVYRPATEDDLDIFEQQMIKSGLYEKEKAWIQAAEWLSDPLTWGIVTAWKDEIIQVEFYHFSNEDKYSVWGGFASHIDRGRPHNFWSKFAIILFDALNQLGVERMNTGVRTDIPEYIAFFKKRYGAIELYRSEDAIATPLCYNIRDVVKNIDRSLITRKTLPSWEWRKGNVVIREGTELDQELVKTWLLRSGSFYTPTNLHFDVLDKWWNLDQATLLLAFKKGELYDAWIIREREKELSGVYSFGFDTAEKLDDMREGMFDWQVKVGYVHSSFFVGKAHAENDAVKKLEAIGWKKEKDHRFPLGEQTEYRLNIKDFKKGG